MSENLTGYPSIDKPWLKYYDPNIISSDIPRMSIYDYVYEKNKNHLDDTVFIYFDKHFTYREFFELIDSIAKALLALGVTEDSIVAVCMPNTPEAFCAMYAINRIGAKADLLDAFAYGSEMIYMHLAETNTDYFIITDIILDKVAAIINEVDLKRIIVKNDINRDIPKDNIFIEWKEFLNTEISNIALPSSYYETMDYSVLEHTGGTTGFPKGAMLTDDGLNGQVWQLSNALGFKRGEIWLGLMPIFSSFGLMGGHLAVSEGLVSVLIPYYDPEKFIDLIREYKPNRFACSPAFWEILLNSKELDEFDLSFLINPIVGGDVVNTKTEKRINELFERKGNPSVLVKGYSCTEASAGTACNINRDINKSGSVGIPLPKVELKIVDPDTLEELTYNEHGEICVSGSNLMAGYYNRPEETANALRKHSDNKLWLHTGDIGYIDEDGFLYITNRIKRIIIRNDGCKVYPSTIETSILKHNSVKECVAVGINDKRFEQGKLPFVFVVLNDDSEIVPEQIKNELFKLCSDNIPYYSMPVDIRFVDSLPRTRIGKIDYRALEEEAEKDVTIESQCCQLLKTVHHLK